MIQDPLKKSRVFNSLAPCHAVTKMRVNKTIILGSVTLFVLSVIDGALTLWGLGLGAIEEVNPVMQWLIEKNQVYLWPSSCRCQSF